MNLIMRIFENIGAENHVSVMYQAPSGFIIAMTCFNHEIWLIFNFMITPPSHPHGTVTDSRDLVLSRFS